MKWDLRWTDERAEEMGLLQKLLNEVQAINRGSHVLQRLATCIEIAERLDKTDYSKGRPSFAFFLNELCIHDRSPGDSRGVFAPAPTQAESSKNKQEPD